MNLTAHYSYVSSDDPPSFYRIPKNKFGFAANIIFSESTNFKINYTYTDKRTVFDFMSYEEVILDSYGLLDVYFQQKIWGDEVIVYGTLNNLLNKHFIGIYGFTTKGRTINAGIKYQF